MLRHPRFALVCLAAALLGSVASARAVTHVFPVGMDSHLEEANPAGKNGADSLLPARALPGDEDRPILWFDVSSIGVGRTVTDAQLWLYVEQADGTGKGVHVYEVTAPWTEDSVTWGSHANAYDDATVYGTFLPEKTGFVSVDVTALVAKWVAGVPNLGLMIVPESSTGTSRYTSKEWLFPAQRPTLIVEEQTLSPSIIDVGVTKLVDDPTPAEGDTINYVVSVRNFGPTKATGLEITDLLPAGVTFTSASASQGSYTKGTGLWLVGSLLNGEFATLLLTATVDAGTAGTFITNVATVTALDQGDVVPGNNVDTADVTVEPADTQPFRMTTGAYVGDGSPVRPLTGLGFAPDVVLIAGSNNEPAALSTQTMGPNAAKRLTDNGGIGPNIVLSLDPDGFTIGSDLTVNDSGVEYFWAAFQSAPGQMALGSYVGDGIDDRSIAGVGFRPEYMMVLSEGSFNAIQRFASEPYPQSLPFNAGIRNDHIQDFESDGFEVGSHASVNGVGDTIHYVAWADEAGRVAEGSYAGNGFDNRDLKIGLRPDLVLIKVDSSFDGTPVRFLSNAGDYTLRIQPGPSYVNGIQALDVDGFQVGSDGSVNEFSESYNYFAMRDVVSADLALAKTVSDSIPQVGDTVTYSIVVSNTGPDPSLGVEVTDLLPFGVTYQSDSPSQGAYDGGDGTWTIGQIDAGDSASLAIDVTVDAGQGGRRIVNRADVTASATMDPDGGNDSDSATVVVQSADLALSKTVDDPTPTEGDTVVFTVNLDNDGPFPAGGIVVADSLPAGLTYVSSTPSQGVYDSGTGLWTVGGLADGSSASLAIVATVDPGTGGSVLTNTATIVTSDREDPIGPNDRSSADVDVQAAALSLTKTVDDPTPSALATIDYTIVLTNAGPDSATGIVVSDPLPAGVTYLSDTPSQGAYDDLSGDWNPGTVASGDSATLVITAQVDAGFAGVTITNSATVTAVDQADPSPGDESDLADITVEWADLQIAKVVDDPTPSEGDSISYTVTLVNAGPDSTSGVTVTDSLPSGVTYQAASPSQGSYVSGTGLWTVGALAAGDSATLTIDAGVDSGTGGTSIPNVATVTGSAQEDPAGANDTDFATIDVQSADLALGQTVDDPTPDEGDAITFTITVGNGGPSDATGVEVTDLLPAGLTYVGDVPSSGTYVSGTGVWTIGTILAFSMETLVVTATVDPGTAGTVITNTAAVTGNATFDPDASNDSTSVGVTVRSADLSVTKIVDDGLPTEGDTVTYTVTVRNAGPDGAAGVELTDLLPAGLTYQGVGASQGSYVSGTGVWTVGAIAAGDSAFLALVADVDPGTGGTVINNYAAVTSTSPVDPVAANDSASVDIDVQSADLGVTKTVNNPNPPEGGTITYTITLANAGPDSATGVVLTDNLPAGVTYQSDAPDQGTYNSISGLWSVGTIAAGDSATLFLTATVDAGTSGTTITNTATITASDQIDPNGANDSDVAAVTVLIVVVIDQADLELIKTVNDGTPDEGDAIQYTLTLTNNGPDAANNVVVTDFLPAGVTYVSDVASRGAYVDGSGLWTIGTVNPLEIVSLDIAVNVESGTAGQTIVNNATISAVDEPDPAPGNESDNAALTVKAADLEVAKTVDLAAPNEGDSVHYTVVLRNHGPDPASSVTLTDLLPAGVTYQSKVTSQGNYVSGTGLWTIGAVAVGDSASLDLFATVDAGTGGTTIVNQASSGGAAQGDPVAANDADSAAVTVQAADLEVTKTVDVASPNEGDTVTYTVVARNLGPDDATGIQLTDLLPSGVTYASKAYSQGNYSEGNGRWTMGTLAAGDSATLTITVDVDAGTAGTTVTNVASVTAVDQADPAPANDSDSADIDVQASDLVVTKVVDDPSPSVADTLRYTVVVHNAGPDAATSVAVTDSLPVGVSYWSDSPSHGTWVGGLWNVGTIAAGDSATLDLFAVVDPGTAGSTITNVASVTGVDQVDVSPGDEADSAAVTVQAADLAVTKTVDLPIAHVGDPVTYTITALNAGPHDASGVEVTDVLPAGVTLQSSLPDQGAWASGTGVWAVGAVAAGDSATLAITALVDSGTVGSTITNVATSTALDQTDAVPANDSDSAAVDVYPDPGVEIRFVTGPGLVSEGQAGLTVQMRIANLGLDAVSVDSLGLSFTRTVSGDLDGDFAFTPDGANAGSIPAQGADWFAFDVNLLGATAGPVTVDGRVSATDLRTGAGVADVDADTTLALTVETPPDLQDQPNTLQPTAFAPGASNVTFTIDVDNLGDASVTLDATSRLRVTAPADTLDATLDPAAQANLAGQSDLLRGGAPTTLTFGPVSVPGAFPSGTHPILLDLVGTDSNGAAYVATVTTQDSIVVSGSGVTVAATQPPQAVRPGQANATLMTVTVANSTGSPVDLMQLELANTTVGPGTPAELDGELGSPAFYQDGNGNGRWDGGDAKLADGTINGGKITFPAIGLTLPDGAIAVFHVMTDVDLAARDGDRLDVEIVDENAVQFDRAVTFFNAFPLAPPESRVVNGMVAAQVTADSLGADTALPGDTDVVAMEAVVPANGYAADVLNEIRLANRGTADGGSDIGAVTIWADGGDGAFDGGAGDDASLGNPFWTGSEWFLGGLAVPVPVGGLPIWVTLDLAPTATVGSTIQLELPAGNGLVMASGNDGPLDAGVASRTTITVPSTLGVQVFAQPAGSYLPGDDRVNVFRFEIANNGTAQETLASLTFTNRTTGGAGATQAQLDADWKPVELLVARSSDIVLPGGPRDVASFSGGLLIFSGLGERLDPGDTLTVVLRSGPSLVARDADALDLSVESASDIDFGRPVNLNTTFPLDPPGSFTVDGMSRAQITVTGGGTPANLSTGSTRNLALDLLVPANGYETDVLEQLHLKNAGTALEGSDVTRVEAWVDADGNGVFEPAGADTLLGVDGNLVFTGDRWSITGLAQAVPDSGLRLFVSCDIADLASESRTVQLFAPAPDGLRVASGNDGPLDFGAGNVFPQTISTVDRLTIAAADVDPGIVVPGEQGVVLLHFVATNTYAVEVKSLTGLRVHNLTTGPGTVTELDGETEFLELRADDPAGPLLATSFFSSGVADFSGFAWDLQPGQERHLYVTAAVSLDDASDADVVRANVVGLTSLTFADDTSVSAAWPLDSGAAWTVDGMVAAQLTLTDAPVATLGPGEGPALALDVVVPANGYQLDVLERIALDNAGTAPDSALAEVRLWRDGGDGAFDGGTGDDIDLLPMALLGGEWTSPTLAESIPTEGVRLFAAVTSAPTLAGDATVKLRLPAVTGVTVQSGNDGPDSAVVNGTEIQLSTAVLLATIDFDQSASTVGDTTVTLRMTVRNVGTTTINGIGPSALTPEGDPTALSVLGGPTPASFDLAPAGEDVFVWTCRADSTGSIRFSASASGTEQGSGLTRQSLDATSSFHQVFLEAQDLELSPVESMPFSINRGQTEVVPLSLTFSNNGGTGGSSAHLRSITFRIEDETATGIVPADLLARVVVNEGATVYFDETALPTSGDSIVVGLPDFNEQMPPVLIPSEQQTTLNLSLDISDSTSVPNFRLVIVDATWFQAEDATSKAPVTTILAPGETFPVQSGLARVVAEATQLDVLSLFDPPVDVGRGQDAVTLLRFECLNPDPDSLAADVRLSSFAVTLTDTSGATITTPSDWLEWIRVRTPVQTLANRAVTTADDSTMTLDLSPLLSLPVETPITLAIEADVADGAPLGGFRLQLADSSTFDARDANTGTPLPVLYDSDPFAGPTVTVQAQADSMLVSAASAMPASIGLGEADVAAMTLLLTHAGGPETAPVRVDSLTIQVRDQLNQPLVPAAYLDRARVIRDTTEVGLITNLPFAGGEFVVVLAGVVVAAGQTDSLEIRFDVEVTAPPSAFQLTIASDGIAAVDENLQAPVTTVPDAGAEFPFTSGLTQLQVPARELAVSFSDSMPPVLAGDGRTVTVATLRLRNDADPTAGTIRVDRFEMLGADRDLVPIDLGEAASRVEVVLADTVWATSGDLAPTDVTATLVAGAELTLEPDEPVEMEVRVTLREGAQVPSLRLGCEPEGIGVVQPASPLLSVTVLAEEGESFPFWTLSGNFAATSLAESYSNFPNPFAAGREETSFAFYLPKPGHVTLKLFSMRGGLVETLIKKSHLPEGLHQSKRWDGRNVRGVVVVNGVYLAEIAVAYDDGTRDRVVRKVAVVR